MTVEIPAAISSRLGPEIYPVYVLEFGTLAGVSFPVRFSTGGRTPGIIALPHSEDWPSLPGRSISPLEGQSSFGKAQYSIVNYDGALEDLLSAYTMTDRPANIYFLLNGVPWADGMQIHAGRVANIKRARDAITWVVEITDQLERTGVTVFKEADIQGEAGSGADKVWPLSGSISGNPQLTLSDADSDGTYDTVVLEGHPLSIALCLLLSGSGEGGTYDVFPAWAGAGLSTSEVDVDAWETARDDQFPMVEMRITLTGPERLKDFLQGEVFKILGGFPVVTGDGKLSCNFFESPSDVGTLTSFTDADLLSVPEWDANHQAAITHIDFELDHDGDSFQTTLTGIFVSEEFMSGRVLKENRLKLSSRGLQTDLGGMSIVRAIADSIFRRYEKPPPKVRFDAMLWKFGTEGGDLVSLESLTYPNVENPQAFGRGAPRYIEIISAGLAKDRVQYEGLDLSALLVEGERIALIAPAGTGAYSASSAALRKYAFLADGSDGLLPDGKPGYRFA